MFFEKKEKVEIDGTYYEVSNGAMVDHFTCKEAIVDLRNYIDPETREMSLTPDTMNSWKKDLVKMLKEWDKCYVKHAKSTYPELIKIIEQAMQPLTYLCKANQDFHNLEVMLASQKYKGLEPPEFRHKALEEEFVISMTGVCEIMKQHGEKPIQ